jgi:DNA-binding MarR family transcriptional regulator
MRNLEQPSANELKTVAALRVALRRFQAATDEITQRHGLSPRWYDLLAVLHEPGNSGQKLTTIGEQLQLRANTITGLITRTEEAGLVTRTRDELDRRVVYAAPTREGTKRYVAALIELRPERTRLLGLLREASNHAEGLIPPHNRR